jgi:curved DNA-binding protein
MKYKDYYKTLGLERGASDEEIKKAYRRLARKYHPDVSKEKDAKERFQDVAEAYETLKDKEKRDAYDNLGRHASGQEFRPPPDWFDRFGRSGGRGGGAFEDIDLSDLFESLGVQRGMRGGARGRRASVPIPGEDYAVTVRLTLEEAARGAEREFRIGERAIHARIPKGAGDGERLRLPGKGGPGAHGGAAGDLYLHIQLEPHPLFRASGHDLEIEVPLAPWEAALGAQVDVPTLDGAVSMKVPGGSRSGQKLRIAGKGLPTPGGGAGDLYAALTIVVPPALNEREKSLYEALREASRFDPRGKFRR